jgi:hypothetical protein
MSRKFLSRLYCHSYVALPLLLLWVQCSEGGP